MVRKGTPLHRALGGEVRVFRRCNEEGVGVLLKYGARVDIRNDKEETAMDIARKKGDTKMVEKLMQHIRDVKRASSILMQLYCGRMADCSN